MVTVRVRFYAELGDLLAPERRGRDFEHHVAAGTTVKDLVEGLGAPHTEVDLVLVNGVSVDFDRQVVDGDRISVYPVFEALDISPVVHLRPEPLREPRFAADVHLGKLARLLRVAGFDTLYRNDWADSELVAIAVAERRTILTRDRRLLMRSVVTHGYLMRHTEPQEQLVEVLDRFDLGASLRPFARCTVCNGLIVAVEKAEVLAQLPPLTATFYDEFWRCSDCRRAYWRGSHVRSLEARLCDAAEAVKSRRQAAERG